MSQIESNDKLYVITRNDLNYGQQASQLCHALRQFNNDHPEIDRAWFENSNYICLLAVESEDDLIKLISKLEQLNLKYSKFNEPDYNNALTAICVEPGKNSKRILKNIKLAFNK